MTLRQPIGETGRTATLIVAANDALDKTKAQADYVCDGVADQVQIDAALAALPATGGAVVLSEGTFNLTATLTLPATPLRLLGQGEFAHLVVNTSTILNFALGAAGNCVEFSDDVIGQEIGNFTIDGDGVNTDWGISIGASSSFKVCRTMLVTGVAARGVDLAAGSSQCYFEQVYVKNSPAVGFSSFGIACTFIYCQATRDAATGVGGNQGFKESGSGSVYVGCVAERHDRGFEVATFARGASLIGCTGENNNLHVRVGTATPNEPVGTSIVGFYGTTAQHVASAAVHIDDSFGTTITGLTILNSTSDKAIEITAAADAVKIVGGYTNDTTPITDGGATQLKIEDFYPFVNEAVGTGSITAAVTSDVIAHGLSATPLAANISVTLTENPTNTPGAIWVDTIGAANFTVNCENVPGVSELDFSWKASVY